MEEIKVGEYCRTEEGEIFKVDEQEIDFYNFQIKKLKPKEIWNPIVKHSSNIIDLIEVGDYVNGLYVHGIYDNGLEVYRYGDCHDILYADEIKSIVTREAMKSVEFRLEG